MLNTFSTVFAAALVALGVSASLNLISVFGRDWLEGRRETPRRRERSRRHAPSEDGDSQRNIRALERTRTHRFLRARSIRVRRVQPHLAAVGIAGTWLIVAPSAHAQAPETPPQPAAAAPSTTTPEPAAEPAKSAISFQLNLDFTNAYFYHGIVQEDSGLIVQPAAKLTFNLYEKDDFSVDTFIATWNSFHGQATGAQTHGDFTEYWYESDLLGGLVLTKGKFSLTTQYGFLASPNDAYETVQELDFILTFDDSEALGKFALHPYALLAIETGADASDGANSDTGTYLELGIAPGFSFDVGETPISISFPASVGLSLQDYYQDGAGEDDTFGFAQVGVKASLPLPFGDRYGKWMLNAGVSGMYLGDHTSNYNGGDREQVIGTIGLQLNF